MGDDKTHIPTSDPLATNAAFPESCTLDMWLLALPNRVPDGEPEPPAPIPFRRWRISNSYRREVPSIHHKLYMCAYACRSDESCVHTQTLKRIPSSIPLGNP